MDIIQVLPEKTAQLIAAGEVVENPSSVVKELVENSIDAGATSITVEILNGGITLIKVSDNGKGMSNNDAKNCFLRHATSKVRIPDDIYNLSTLGFRGEALASIAAVAKVRLTTAQQGAQEGYSVCVEGGKITESYSLGCNAGTIITVKDIFFNTPARKKFLKSERAEAGAISSLMDKLSLSHPEISFRLISNGKEELFTPGDSKLISAIMAVWGTKSIDQVLEVNSLGDFKITGFISKPLFSKGTRQMQLFYVNNRIIQSRLLSAAVEEAYKGSIMVGKFPTCVLNIEMNSSLVDVNVHPAKNIVKFSDDKLVFSAIHRAVSLALANEKQQYTATPEIKEEKTAVKQEQVPEIKVDKPKAKEKNMEITVEEAHAIFDGLVEKPLKQPSLDISKIKKHEPLVPLQEFLRPVNVNHRYSEEDIKASIGLDKNLTFKDFAQKVIDEHGQEMFMLNKDEVPNLYVNTPFLVSDEEELTPEPVQIDEPIEYVGEVLKSYIIAKTSTEVYIIDKHAAHERLIYENLKKNINSVPSQPLLLSLNISMDKRDKAILMDNEEILTNCGFEIENMYGNHISVKAIPQILEEEDCEAVLNDIVQGLKAGKVVIELDKMERILEITSCKAAIKAGQKNDPIELQKLINELFSIPDVKYCPHGRPIIYTLQKRDFEKFFKRIG